MIWSWGGELQWIGEEATKLESGLCNADEREGVPILVAFSGCLVFGRGIIR